MMKVDFRALMKNARWKIKLLLLPVYSPEFNPVEVMDKCEKVFKNYSITFPALHLAISDFLKLE